MRKIIVLVALCTMFIGCSVNQQDEAKPNKQTSEVETTTTKSIPPVDYKVLKKSVLYYDGFSMDYESIEVISVEGHTIISHKWRCGYAGGMSDTHIANCPGCLQLRYQQ